MEKADWHLTLQEAKKDLVAARKELASYPPANDKEPLLSPTRRARQAAQMRIRDARGLIESANRFLSDYGRGEGSRAIKRLKRNGFTMKDIQSYRS